MLDLFGNGETPDIQFTSAWLDADAAEVTLNQILNEVPWRQDAMSTGYGRVSLPRLTAWQGEPDAVYVYSGIRNSPSAWTPGVLALKDRLSAELQVEFNSVLLNRYRGGSDSIGWHADDEPELGDEPVIASVSLGATRTFELRHRKQPRLLERYSLNSGSLLVMKGQTQKRWVHRIPKEPSVQGERVNLTFRQVFPR